MSAPTDVLEVMERLAKETIPLSLALEIVDVRDTIAELIVAAEWVQRRAKDYNMPTDGLDAAIARCKGEIQ